MGVLALLALGLGLVPSSPDVSVCTMGEPTLRMLHLPGGDSGRIAIGGPPVSMARLFDGRPALVAAGGEEIPLDLVERPTDGRNPLVALYAPRTPLAKGRVYGLKSWWGSRVERRELPARDAPPPWNGTIVAEESAAGVTLRFTPPVGPLVRVVSGAQRSLVSVTGHEVDLGCIGCRESLDLGHGRAVVTVTAIDAWGREAAPRTFEVVQPRKLRGKGCRVATTTTRVVSEPVPEPPLAGWSLLRRLFVFGSLPFFLSYGAVTAAMGIIRRRRRRIIAQL